MTTEINRAEADATAPQKPNLSNAMCEHFRSLQAARPLSRREAEAELCKQIRELCLCVTYECRQEDLPGLIAEAGCRAGLMRSLWEGCWDEEEHEEESEALRRAARSVSPQFKQFTQELFLLTHAR